MLTFPKCPRLFGWLIVTILLLVAIAFLAPQQLPVSLYKLSLVSMAGVVGYWLDRSLFPYARPDALTDYCAVDDIESLEDLKLDEGENPEPILAEFDTRANIVFGLAMLRRAIIVGCAMLALGLGA
ncbi:membrane protein [Zoogloea oryzae]|uniref:Membrane protein n=1 Tax=Zoogloea oryzae TaxID=310767 RepID=A0ABQ6FD59_9RHOO|nr:putative holin [Zoogloea oryzae]GLT22665.1 membrane protein [Zoogloea oryzae]